MALIKLTAFLDNISGKVNGSVFSKNKGGNYVRSKSNPSNPQTIAQMLNRSIFGAISSAWRGLTDGQRKAWDTGAGNYPYQNRLGDTKILSGFALHQKLNRNLQLINQAMVVTPPNPTETPSPTALQVTNEAPGTLDVVGSIAISASGVSLLVYATPAISNGVANFDSSLRLIGVLRDVELNAGEDMAAEYAAVFGAYGIGDTLGFKVVPINMTTGADGSPFYTKFVTTQ